MTQHRFTTSAAAHASGIATLLSSRIEEVRKRTGHAPQVLVMHDHSLRALVAEQGGPELPKDMEVIVAGFDGVPLMLCRCTNPMPADWLIDCNGNKEEV